MSIFRGSVLTQRTPDGVDFCDIEDRIGQAKGRRAMKKAPWTQETVDALNRHQQDGRFHPYTCPGDKPECHAQRDLIATPDGWVCKCGAYRQDWAH